MRLTHFSLSYGTQFLKALSDESRVRNTTLVYSPAGECVARYDKIHLFRFDNGRERYDESRVIEAGAEPVVFELPSRSGRTPSSTSCTSGSDPHASRFGPRSFGSAALRVSATERQTFDVKVVKGHDGE